MRSLHLGGERARAPFGATRSKMVNRSAVARARRIGPHLAESSATARARTTTVSPSMLSVPRTTPDARSRVIRMTVVSFSDAAEAPAAADARAARPA
jgi:hypothetical protein